MVIFTTVTKNSNQWNLNYIKENDKEYYSNLFRISNIKHGSWIIIALLKRNKINITIFTKIRIKNFDWFLVTFQFLI